MAWFQLAPADVAARLAASHTAPGATPPTLQGSLLRGTLGFTIVSVAGFAPWAFAGRWFYRLGAPGELAMYVACALVFILGSGLLLHPLILGPGSLSRFNKLFAATFSVYAAGWTAGWMALGGHAGSLAGLLAGTAAMGWMLARAFDARDATLKVILALFALNTAGYFVGGWVDAAVRSWPDPHLFGSPLSRRAQARMAMLSWGVCYGLGFGAALGWAFHLCQAQTRALIYRSADAPGKADNASADNASAGNA